MTKRKSAFQKTWVYKALLKIYDVIFTLFLCMVRGIKKLIGYFL